ncbi:dihydrofolate reductase family protein [Streptomyces sp. TRM66268-LWL]|uniref:Dihydrofolate reductase family protein n=1 Tax=Streptomyces polyasparticus TaxID=2767826 RepID=A0ABR7SHL9_9ACTN|nr:dihydrofolate reductase family protein [Streptomyces polyasparticus]MBC9715021.1 dihydrofolate reductase family protein [Streptomyces polyasparticus]
MNNPTARKVTANISLTLDGRYHGAAGPGDMGAIVPYAVTDTARDHLARIWQGKSTAVFGRGNALGFVGYWSAVAEDEHADPRDRGYAQWLVGAEKVVFSTTLTEAPWERSRVVNGPTEEVIRELKSEAGEGDILVNTAPSVLKPLLAADLVDRLYLMITPEITGGGERLFEDGLPASQWTLTHQETGKLGELALVYDRVR